MPEAERPEPESEWEQRASEPEQKSEQLHRRFWLADSAAFVFVFQFGQVAFIKYFSQLADDFGVDGIRHKIILSF